MQHELVFGYRVYAEGYLRSILAWLVLFIVFGLTFFNILRSVEQDPNLCKRNDWTKMIAVPSVSFVGTHFSAPPFADVPLIINVSSQS